MAVTILRRKALRNQTRSVNRLNKIKDLMRKPEVRNVDVDAIKAEFAEMKKQREAEEKTTATPAESKKTEATQPKQAEPKAKEGPQAEAKAAGEPEAESETKAPEDTEEADKK